MEAVARCHSEQPSFVQRQARDSLAPAIGRSHVFKACHATGISGYVQFAVKYMNADIRNLHAMRQKHRDVTPCKLFVFFSNGTKVVLCADRAPPSWFYCIDKRRHLFSGEMSASHVTADVALCLSVITKPADVVRLAAMFTFDSWRYGDVCHDPFSILTD